MGLEGRQKQDSRESFECLVEELRVYPEAMMVKSSNLICHSLYLSFKKFMTRVEKIVEAARLEAGGPEGRDVGQPVERCWLPLGFPMSVERSD